MKLKSYGHCKPEIAKSAYIDPFASVTGKVSIGEDSSMWAMTSARGDVNWISIGVCTNIQEGTILHTTHEDDFSPKAAPLIIGNYVTVGHNVTLHSCQIEDFSLIGIGSIVLDSAVVQKNALVGAGSLVPPGKIIEGGYLWLGNPIKKIRKLTPKDIEFFTYSAKAYVKLKNDTLARNEKKHNLSTNSVNGSSFDASEKIMEKQHDSA